MSTGGTLLTLAKSRSLKIEADGDRFRGFKPKIRLAGKWLQRAGFEPENRVDVVCLEPGTLQLTARQNPNNSKSRYH